MLQETAEAAVDAEDTADWRRVFDLGWRSGALGDLEAREELARMGEEAEAAEAEAEGEDQ